MVAAIAAAVDVPVQTGGGVRDVDAARALADAGVARVVIGTAAVEEPELVGRLAPLVAGGRGARRARPRGRRARAGSRASGADVADLLPGFEDAGAAAAVVTQIDVDGTGCGPGPRRATRELLAVTRLP